MVTGIWMSFLKLTKAFISNWGNAPVTGLKNYQVALDFNGAVSSALLQSFLVTCAFTVLVVGISCTLGMAAAVALQGNSAARASSAHSSWSSYALPMYAGIIAWKFMLQKDTRASNHFIYDNLSSWRG